MHSRANRASPVLSLSTKESSKLLKWTDGSSISQIYQCSNGTFNFTEWRNVTIGASNLIILGRTTDGTVVGGYTGNQSFPTYLTFSWISSSDMFIFNLKKGKKWDTSYKTSNILVNTYGDHLHTLIDFGYNSALEFDFDDENQPAVKYAKYGDFKKDPSNSDFGIPEGKTPLTSFEVYQIQI